MVTRALAYTRTRQWPRACHNEHHSWWINQRYIMLISQRLCSNLPIIYEQSFHKENLESMKSTCHQWNQQVINEVNKSSMKSTKTSHHWNPASLLACQSLLSTHSSWWMTRKGLGIHCFQLCACDELLCLGCCPGLVSLSPFHSSLCVQHPDRSGIMALQLFMKHYKNFLWRLLSVHY